LPTFSAAEAKYLVNSSGKKRRWKKGGDNGLAGQLEAFLKERVSDSALRTHLRADLASPLPNVLRVIAVRDGLFGKTVLCVEAHEAGDEAEEAQWVVSFYESAFEARTLSCLVVGLEFRVLGTPIICDLNDSDSLKIVSGVKKIAIVHQPRAPQSEGSEEPRILKSWKCSCSGL
jgi:hypothetical protein